ncbi:unnamed protein product [Effrenium voratum]|nr:unnamed protein product [Effrenium voratum]
MLHQACLNTLDIISTAMLRHACRLWRLAAVPAVPTAAVRFSTGPAREQLASSGYPDMSPSRHLLDRCLEAAAGRGVDSSDYHPWLPVDLFQTLLVDIHEYAGCSWFTAIVCTCLAIRALLMPVTIAAMRGSREKAILQPEYEELMQKQKALRMDSDPDKSQKIQKKLQAFTQKHGRLFMMKGTWNLFLVQMPLYITAFAALRGMANHPDMFRGFAMESPLWLESLALADPYCILPVITGAIMITNTELFGSVDTEATQIEEKGDGAAFGQNTMQKYQKHIMRGSAVLFIPMTMNFPAGVFIFMSSNMAAAAAQSRALRHPLAERWLELPSPKPAKDAKASSTAARATPHLDFQKLRREFLKGTEIGMKLEPPTRFATLTNAITLAHPKPMVPEATLLQPRASYAVRRK